ncbi:uncharacterized protein LOC110414148 [Herrania umbratica]|uniref:Uncharacterized protein LOC110414148 n=1 Tax=Herrania umbratica TaxID=108875 RepID=A0A6J1A2L4_9ROSI|nr:uncharacterized protein LOC110414148 [Herrania umbratica]
MGNCVGRSNLTVKPLDSDIGMMKSREEDGRRRSFDAPSSPMRIKVRMTKRQLEELKARAVTRKGTSELGRLIVKECFEGRLSPRVVVGQVHISENSRLRRLSLSTIDEEATVNDSLFGLVPVWSNRCCILDLSNGIGKAAGRRELAPEIYIALGDSENVLGVKSII